MEKIKICRKLENPKIRYSMELITNNCCGETLILLMMNPSKAFVKNTDVVKDIKKGIEELTIKYIDKCCEELDKTTEIIVSNLEHMQDDSDNKYYKIIILNILPNVGGTRTNDFYKSITTNEYEKNKSHICEVLNNNKDAKLVLATGGLDSYVLNKYYFDLIQYIKHTLKRNLYIFKNRRTGNVFLTKKKYPNHPKHINENLKYAIPELYSIENC